MSMKGDQSSASSELTGVRVTQARGATVTDKSTPCPTNPLTADSLQMLVLAPLRGRVVRRAPEPAATEWEGEATTDAEQAAEVPLPKRFRKVRVLPSADGQFFYVASARKDEKVYTSETFPRRTSAINAARREHEGRNEKYDYLLEYENNKGYLVRETS